MKTVLGLVCAVVMTLPASADEFTRLFDGKTLKGWKTHPDGTGKWKVEDGCIVGSGPVSHLFTDRDDFADIHLRAEVSINDGGNSGMYFRTQFGPGYPRGYEAQINSTHRDPVKTGSLYTFAPNVREVLVKPGEFFTYEVIVKGNMIEIKVNGKTTVKYEDKKETFKKGHIAFQQHHEGSVVKIKSVEVKELK
jgi:hypothetical protein